MQVLPEMTVYVQTLPWFPVIDVILYFKNGNWVNVYNSKFEIWKDYNFQLWWLFGAEE